MVSGVLPLNNVLFQKRILKFGSVSDLFSIFQQNVAKTISWHIAETFQEMIPKRKTIFFDWIAQISLAPAILWDKGMFLVKKKQTLQILCFSVYYNLVQNVPDLQFCHMGKFDS